MPDSPLLIVDNIHKRFADLEVLHGLSLTAKSGDVISLIGSSGSGKSTFLRCINLLEIPDQGDISLAGDAITFAMNKQGQRETTDALQVQQLRSKVAMVFQQFNLWSHMTVLQNVIEAPMRVKKMPFTEAKELGMHFLNKVGISDKADTYSAFLSGGQQQRVAIARALAIQPDVILFDEPTSALDPELVGEVLNVMRQLAEEGTTMIVVTHEMSFARNVSNKAIFLHEGKIEEEGEPSALFDAPSSDRLQQFLSKTAA